MFVLAALVYVCASRSLAVPVKKSGHAKSMGGLLDLCFLCGNQYGCWLDFHVGCFGVSCLLCDVMGTVLSSKCRCTSLGTSTFPESKV